VSVALAQATSKVNFFYPTISQMDTCSDDDAPPERTMDEAREAAAAVLFDPVQAECDRLNAMGGNCSVTSTYKIHTTRQLPDRIDRQYVPDGIISLFREYRRGINDEDRRQYAITRLRKYRLIPDKRPGDPVRDPRNWVNPDETIASCFEDPPPGGKILILKERMVID
jgi:hypothetical protein